MAILFASGEPVFIEKLFDILGEFEVSETICEINELLENTAMTVLRFDDKLQMVTKPDYVEIISLALEENYTLKLSNSALEVLVIIAYNQPITRVKVDNIRGIDSAYTVSNLVHKGFIEPCGKLDVVGKPNLYKTTDKFLKSFNLKDLSCLPDITEFESVSGEV